jgi:hypothetical protein
VHSAKEKRQKLTAYHKIADRVPINRLTDWFGERETRATIAMENLHPK